MLPIKEIEDFVKENQESELVTHGFGHLKRVAIGAVWFVKILCGDKEEQDMAYIAGIMEKNWIRHVPIVDGERVIGVVSQRDIARTKALSSTAAARNGFCQANSVANACVRAPTLMPCCLSPHAWPSASAKSMPMAVLRNRKSSSGSSLSTPV